MTVLAVIMTVLVAKEVVVVKVGEGRGVGE